MGLETNISIPVETLLSLLRAEGIKDIGTTAVLDIQKIIASLDDSVVSDFRNLKYYIGPIVCRNKEDQQIFSRVFDRYVQMVEAEKSSISGTTITKKRRYRWLMIGVSLAAVVALWTWWITRPAPQPYLSLTQTTYWPLGKFADDAVGDSIGYEAFLQDTIPGKTYSVHWKLADSSYNNVHQFRTVFKDTGTYTAYAVLKDARGDTIFTDSIKTTVVCEHLPALNIISSEDAGKRIYQPAFGDTLVNENNYSYKWFINDSLVSSQKTFLLNYPASQTYQVKLLVDTKEQYCGINLFTATHNETPSYALVAHSLGPVRIVASFQTGNFLLLVLLLFTAAAISWLIFQRWKKPPPIKESKIFTTDDEQKKDNDRSEGPFVIEFRNQDHKITTEENVSRLADGLRKRQLSNVYKLDVRKTIDKTIRGGGFPFLQFSPKTKPVDFLVFLDKEHPESHLVKLFEYLVERLRMEQVNIVLYDYYKEPSHLNNARLNHVRLPVEKVKQLYPETILILFTTGEYLLEPFSPKLKPWVQEKINLWQHLIIITPLPSKDWTYKEIALQRAGFLLIPADLYQNDLLKILLDLINLQVESTKQDKIEIPGTYSARYYKFQDFGDLSRYLDNDQLLDWVSATAVYPNVDWKVTLAIGKALEELQTGRKTTLVNYENLLKISRISWMQDGIIDDLLRLEMLRHINNETEAAARKAVIELLDEIKEQFKPNSFAKEEFDLHRNSNLVLLRASDESINVPDETLSAMKDYLDKGYIDWAQRTYHDEARNTLLTGSGSSTSTSLEDYLRILSREARANKINQEEKRREQREEAVKKEKDRRRLRNFVTVAAFVLLSAIGTWLLYNNERLQLWQSVNDGLSIVLSEKMLTQFGPITAQIEADSTFDGEKQNDSTIRFPGLSPSNKNEPVTLLIQAGNYETMTTTISADSSYAISITESPRLMKRPLLLRYNDSRYYAAIQQQLNNELYAYNLSQKQQDFTDSSHLIYYGENQKAMADSVADIINNLLKIKIGVSRLEARDTALAPVLYLNLSRPSMCTDISLPGSLQEIWTGKTNGRLININLRSNLVYYSTGEKNTYGIYRIDEVCLDANGTYRLITKAGNQYQAFYMRNVQPTSFMLSVCPKRYSNKEEVGPPDTNYCDQFNLMTIYLADRGGNNISTNVRGQVNFSDAQKSKLEKILLGTSSNAVITVQANMNTAFQNPGIDSRYGTIQTYFPKGGPSRLTNPVKYDIRNNRIQWVKKEFNGTPFDRDFINVTSLEPPRPDEGPRCDYTYRSMEEAIKAGGSRVVCKLNLENDSLAKLPAELFSFKYMQELNLGATTVPQADIDRLQDSLPKCVIRFNRNVVPPSSGKETQLGELQFTVRENINSVELTSESMKLITRIAFILQANAASKIRLEATLNNASEQKSAQTLLAYVRNSLYKYGVSQKGNKISEQLKLLSAPLQKTMSKSGKGPEYPRIAVVGLNWQGK